MDDATALTLTDECDDEDELGDLPSASGSAVDMFPESSGSSFKNAVRRRSSKGPSWSSLFPSLTTECEFLAQRATSVVNPSASVKGHPKMSRAKLVSC